MTEDSNAFLQHAVMQPAIRTPFDSYQRDIGIRERLLRLLAIGVHRMPLIDIVVLATIVIVFTTFGIVLAGITWYCSDKRQRSVDYPRGHRGLPVR
jgi:multisubunit Na+/H+ antiporter MnhC subunit